MKKNEGEEAKKVFRRGWNSARGCFQLRNAPCTDPELRIQSAMCKDDEQQPPDRFDL